MDRQFFSETFLRGNVGGVASLRARTIPQATWRAMTWTAVFETSWRAFAYHPTESGPEFGRYQQELAFVAPHPALGLQPTGPPKPYPNPCAPSLPVRPSHI